MKRIENILDWHDDHVETIQATLVILIGICNVATITLVILTYLKR